MDDEELRNRLVLVIEEHGFAVQTVFPVKGQGDQEWFYYTIGLTSLDHPEIAIYNLDQDTASTMLQYLGEQVMAGRRFEAGTSTTDINRRGHPVHFIRADDAVLGLAYLVYGDVDAIQLVYPDRKGRYPWNAGYRASRRMPQRLKGAPPANAEMNTDPGHSAQGRERRRWWS